jgi:NAD(P)H-nitrite reductase large subunit
LDRGIFSRSKNFRMQKNIVIIGNGISGITCARHIRKLSEHKITVISAESEYFYSRTALMYIYMGHIRFEDAKPYEDFFWQKNRINLLKKYVQSVDPAQKQIVFEDGQAMTYDELVFACGSQSNKFGWPGEELIGVQGLYNLQDLELMEENTKDISRAVVVGGGLIGIEMAEMLRSRKIEVTFLVREKSFWNNVLPPESSMLINKHIHEHQVDLRLETELKEIKGDSAGKVTSIITNTGEEIACEFVALTVGVKPNVGFLKNSNIEIDKGVMVNEFFETNIEGIYAIGDCAQFRRHPRGRRAIEQVWYTGKEHGEVLAQTLCGNKTAYRPGNWFNSAKFFDMEYQTYGSVGNVLAENEMQFMWMDKPLKKCLRLVYDKENERLLGINCFGIRFRHEVCDRWLTEGKTIDEVMEALPAANFDPEFFKRHEGQILEAYNQQTGKSLKLKEAKGLLKRIFNV